MNKSGICVGVVGSRNFSDYDLLNKELSKIHKSSEIRQIISGGAKGADTLAEIWARDNRVPTKIFYPDWKKLGKAAGIIRNKDIVGNSDFIIAFWDGESRGTKSSIDIAKSSGKKIKVILF